MDLERFAKLKKRQEQLKSKQQQAKGSLLRMMQELKQEFDCDTLDDAEQLLQQLKTQQAALEAEFKTALAKYEAEFACKT